MGAGCWTLCGAPGGRLLKRCLAVLLVWGLLVLGVLQLREGRVDSHIDPRSRLLLMKAVADLRMSTPHTDASSGGGQSSTTTLESLLGAEPFVDKNGSNRTQAEAEAEIARTLPHVPVDFWLKNKNRPMFYKNESCAKMPSIFELEFNNVYWQTMHTTNGTFQLYGAYYDVRRLSRIGPAVRILGMINRIEPTVKTYCQFWFDSQKEPVLVKTMEYKYIWYKKWGNYKQGIYQPYLIACQIPKSHHNRVPISVSMVERPCDMATNHLRVLYDRPPVKKGFAVCVKGLDFLHEDLSVRLVEWIELLGILGAEKVFFYELQVHPNISKVLRHYEREGRASVTPLTLPGGQPNIPGFQHMYLVKKVNHKRQNELIPYNDCLYKNLYTYEYIALLDIDEVIMPIAARDWRQLMDQVLPKALAVKNETRASYNVRNVYFLDDLIHAHGWFKDIPRYMHMLQHVYRSKNFTKPNQYVKCFHNPERALTLHNHFPLSCLGSGCTSYPIETTDAQLQHYRADCVRTLKKSCVEYRQNSVADTTIWRYKDQLIARTTETLRALGFFGPAAAAAGPLQGPLGSLGLSGLPAALRPGAEGAVPAAPPASNEVS